MGEKDMAEKSLEGYNDVFADIVNVLLFKGKRIVKEADLEDALPRSFYKADGKMREQERDVAKYWNRDDTGEKSSIRIALLGIENETKQEKFMPVRIIGYDGAAYRGQLKKDTKEVFPIISFVLYFGFERWNEAKKLSESIQVPKELKPFFKDYEINIFEIAFLSDEQVNLFRSDFRIVADYFVQMRKNNKYILPKGTVNHVREILDFLKVFLGTDRYEEIIKENMEGNGMSDNWFDEFVMKIENRGEERGVKIGEERGVKIGEEKIIEKALRKGKTAEEIAEFTGIPIKDVIAVEKKMLQEV